MTKAKSISKKSNGLKRRAEKLLSQKGEDIQKMPIEDVKILVHELQVHQIELEMQNEELRKAHDELEIGVQERTEELVKANKTLQAEIIERERLRQT